MSDVSALLTKYAPILTGVSFTGIVVGIERGFNWCDGLLNDDARSKLSKWLKNVPGDEQIDIWGAIFPHLIDRVFGKDPRSWRFFIRSCIASSVAVTGMAVISWHHVTDSPYPILHKTQNVLTLMIFMGLVANCIFDYFSLLISRFFVGAIRNHSRPIPVLLLLISDTVLTGTLSLLAVKYLTPAALGTAIGMEHSLPLFSVDDNFEPSILWTINAVYHNGFVPQLHFSDIAVYIKAPFQRVFILASFFTSIWVWLYVLASTAIRILHKLRFVWTRVVPFLNVDMKPMQSIGKIAGLFAGIGYGAILGAVWLYRHL